MTVAQWVGSKFLTIIPVVGLIFNLFWLFGGGRRQDRTNFVRASLLFSVVLLVLEAILIAVLVFVLKFDFNTFWATIQSAFQKAFAK